MALYFNLNSESNQSYGLGLHHNQSVNGQFHLSNSNAILGDHANENVFGRSQPSQFNPDMGLHQTSQFTSQLGQDLGVITNEVKNTCLVPQRIQVVQTVNVDYIPPQNPSIGPLGGQVCVAEVVRTTQEVVRTQLTDSASTRERFLGPNRSFCVWNNQGQTNLQNQATHSTFNVAQQFGDVSQYHNPIQNFGHGCLPSNCPNVTQSSSPYFHNPTYEPCNTHVQTPSKPMTRENRISEPQRLGACFPSGTNNPNPSQNVELQNFAFSNYRGNNQVFYDQGYNISEGYGEEYEIGGDGRTHSLPYEKYGPYTCPRCKGVFATSQMFAAHMGSHYKYETAEQRRKRHLAKYGKKHLRLVQSRDELSVVPYKPSKEFAQVVEHTRNEVPVDVKGGGTIGKELVLSPFRGETFGGLLGASIKEEPMEM